MSRYKYCSQLGAYSQKDDLCFQIPGKQTHLMSSREIEMVKMLYASL